MTPVNPVGNFLAGRQGAEQNKLLQMQQQNAQLGAQRDTQRFGMEQERHQADMQQRQLAMQQELGAALQWADTPEKWDQAVQFFEANGMPGAAEFRGAFAVRPVLQAGLGQNNDPAAVREYQFYQNLPPEKKAEYLNVKRASIVTDVAGVPTQVTPSGLQNPLSNLGAEAGAVATLEDAKVTAGEAARTEAELTRNEPKRQEKARQQIAAIDNTFAAIDRAMGAVGMTTAGPIGSLMQNIPGTSAKDLQQTITTIKANIGFDRLQMMRDASPTGGALGQVAIQELSALQASIASLDQSQTPTQLRQNLDAVRRHYESWKEAVMQSVEPQSDGWEITVID